MIAEQDRTPDAMTELLKDPATARSVAEFLEKLPDLNATLDVLHSFVVSSSRLADNASDIVQTARDAASKEDLSIERLESLMQAAGTGTRLLEEMSGPLGDPETVTSLKHLVEMLPKLVAAVQILDQFLASSTRFAENLNDIVVTARKAAEKSWPELDDRKGLLDLPAEIFKVVESPALRRLLTSQVLSDDALDVMDRVAEATVEAHAHVISRDARVGRIGAFKALGDPDVQRGLALTLELARSLGRRLGEESREDGAGRAAAAESAGHGGGSTATGPGGGSSGA